MNRRILGESIFSNSDKKCVFATEKVLQESAERFLNKSSCKINDKISMIRSCSDKFDYRIIQLENGLRILLISDPSYKSLSRDNSTETLDEEIIDDQSDNSANSSGSGPSLGKINQKMSACMVAVNVGSFQDPPEIQGMAHMIEHLLTMGSEKYPAENEIDEFVSSHGGYQNAHTDVEYTIYEINVHRKHLRKVIDLIGHSFISPLLREKSIRREIKAIDTEFIEASNDDDCRVEVLLSHLADPDHPANKFSWGNRKSLIDEPRSKGFDVRKTLVKFYNSFYKPENIVVVVQSQESLETLEDWATSVFSLVKARNNPDGDMIKNSFKMKLPFSDDNTNFHRLYYVESIDSGTRLLVNWCLPPVTDQYLVAPVEYWASIIGFEGKGSLISLLRERDLAIDLFTHNDNYCFSNNHFFCLFQIDIHLTEKGYSKLDQVIKLLFEFIITIQREGAKEYYFREKQIIALNSFNKRSEKTSDYNSYKLAKNFLYLPVEHLLTGNSLFYYYNKKMIDDFGSKLIIDKANFIILTKQLKDNLAIITEPWMSIDYQSLSVPEIWIEEVKTMNQSEKKGPSYFHYPEPNRFITRNFELLSEKLPLDCLERKNSDRPTKIIDEPRIVVWHKTDFKFGLPKASINLHILSPHNESTLGNVARNALLEKYLSVVLKEDTYDAYEARLNWEFDRTVYGLTLQAKGFNEKLCNLVEIVLERFPSVDFKDDLLKSAKKDLVKEYKNHCQDSSLINQQIFAEILLERHQTDFKLIPRIQAISKPELIQYKNRFVSNVSIEILSQGNISIKETMNFAEKVKSIFNLSSQNEPPIKRKKFRISMIPVGTKTIRLLTLTPTNKISHVEVYQQLGPFNLRSSIYLCLFTDMINEQCFHILRTMEGLGYHVGCIEQKMFGILGFSLFVASNADKFDCTFIQARIQHFLDDYCTDYILHQLTEDKFKDFVLAKITEKLSPDLNIDMEVTRNWSQIASYDYCFDKIKKEVAALQKSNIDDFKGWVLKNILLPWNERKILSVQVVGNGKKALDECLTFEQKPITTMVFKDIEQVQNVTLVQSKNLALSDIFVSDIDSFKKNLTLYPSQPPLKDII